MLAKRSIFPKMVSEGLQNLHISVPTAVDDIQARSNSSGRPNQAVTKPISLDAETGEVLVRKSTGKTKIRKGQSSEEYENEKSHFFDVEKGPVWTPVGWMTKEVPLPKKNSESVPDLTLKQARQKLMGYCHILYYRKRYHECAQACESLITQFENLESRKRVQKEIDELKGMLEQSRTKHV
ncbi:LAFA_0F17414g1_1 [Lachancea sp. 'fantastica']|nr:LAFA_0F17414g1_1 [Lachancea sp. 'fantastica']